MDYSLISINNNRILILYTVQPYSLVSPLAYLTSLWLAASTICVPCF